VESVRLFDAATGRSLRTLDFPGTVRWLGFRPDGRALAAASESPDNRMLVFDLVGGGPAWQLEGSASPRGNGAWRADGGLLAAVGPADGTVRLWEFGPTAPRQRVVTVFAPNANTIDAVALAPEGRHLVTANSDGTIAILRLTKRGDLSRVP
jgi:WD40 repeat protein